MPSAVVHSTRNRLTTPRSSSRLRAVRGADHLVTATGPGDHHPGRRRQPVQHACHRPSGSGSSCPAGVDRSPERSESRARPASRRDRPPPSRAPANSAPCPREPSCSRVPPRRTHAQPVHGPRSTRPRHRPAPPPSSRAEPTAHRRRPVRGQHRRPVRRLATTTTTDVDVTVRRHERVATASSLRPIPMRTASNARGITGEYLIHSVSSGIPIVGLSLT